MPEIEEWLQLLHSDNRGVRVRAAKALLKREDVPLEALRRQLANRPNDSVNVRWPIEAAIRKLDPDAKLTRS
jgi:predicted metallo-beta-lactamase superfamily hydrolase